MSSAVLAEKIREYISKRQTDRLEKLDKEADKARKQFVEDQEALAAFDRDYAVKRQEEVERYNPVSWLSDAANRAKQINLVTHALKFTHSDAKGSGVLLANADPNSKGYLSSSQLADLTADVVGNAAALDVANLLLLEHDSVRLLDYIVARDTAPLNPFSGDGDQVSTWLEGFAMALSSGSPSSHTLAKQVYFPVTDGEYHLLAPLASSALTQAIHQKVMDARFGVEAKAAREARKKKEYHSRKDIMFLDLAVQAFGGTKPQNISLKNSQRGGKAFLINCQPPSWRDRLAAPKDSASFWRGFRREVATQVRELQRFLVAVHDQDSNVRIRNRRRALAAGIVDEFLQYALRFHSLPAGWSRATELDQVEACLLDPKRADEVLLSYRADNSWQRSVAQRCADELNRSLRSKQWLMSDTEHSYWVDLMTPELTRLQADLEALS
ncbi:type I-F CRISPR-associated protein Csy1 [Marinobacterium nitratireducens]|uniref:Type I-F CRISPR-associated protein Csy1 n=1 Tax=Marinobacterium nitratireducens TaxID=518897 RepID=A0A917ZBP7_9GAMM|nr:type I-F CRISPR-associated protein Csy1 [Marinobacterium nitratireducens]GGO80061.1 type I-F CRISPR-associated protein Csy1 [Marinobacterium nitratireducens]